MRMGDTHDGTEVMWVRQDTSEMKVKLPQGLELTDPKIGGSNRGKAMSMGPPYALTERKEPPECV